MKTVPEVNAEEIKQREAFLAWRIGQEFSLNMRSERDLHDYVNGLIMEVADLKAELIHAKINVLLK